MTMHPDNRPMPPGVRVWTDEEAERVAVHIMDASIYSALHEDADGSCEGMGAAAWAAAALIVAVAALLVTVFVL